MRVHRLPDWPKPLKLSSDKCCGLVSSEDTQEQIFPYSALNKLAVNWLLTPQCLVEIHEVGSATKSHIRVCIQDIRQQMDVYRYILCWLSSSVIMWCRSQPPELTSFPSLYLFSNINPTFELEASTVAATVSLLSKSGKVNYQRACVEMICDEKGNSGRVRCD